MNAWFIFRLSLYCMMACFFGSIGFMLFFSRADPQWVSYVFGGLLILGMAGCLYLAYGLTKEKRQ